jgi:hypothetical protein
LTFFNISVIIHSINKEIYFMSNHNTVPTTETNHSHPFELNQRGRRILAGAALLGALTAGAATGNHLSANHEVDSITIGVPEGGSAIGTVEMAAHELANKHDLVPNDIADQVTAGMDVAAKMHDQTHRPLQPGEQVRVTLQENNLNQYSVSADPANLGGSTNH